MLDILRRIRDDRKVTPLDFGSVVGLRHRKGIRKYSRVSAQQSPVHFELCFLGLQDDATVREPDVRTRYGRVVDFVRRVGDVSVIGSWSLGGRHEV